jgi:hypothetical protein
MTLPKPRNRRVIGTLMSPDDPEGDVFLTRRSITRDDRIPRAYAYSNSPTTTAGSNAARPCPSRRHAA